MIIDPNDLTPRDRYFLMIGSIVPRPIAFVSTIGADGTLNLAPISFECRLRQVVEIGGTTLNGPTTAFILGDVLRMHIRDGLLVDGHIDADALEPVGRMGNLEYCRTGDRFERRRPKG